MAKSIFDDEEFEKAKSKIRHIAIEEENEETPQEIVPERVEEPILEMRQEQPAEPEENEPVDLEKEAENYKSEKNNTLDGNFFDVEDAGNNMVLEDEDEDENEKDEIDKKDKSDGKKTFEEANRKYTPPKLNKKRISLIFVSSILTILLVFNLALGEKKKREQKNKEGRNVQADYKPDFGNYRERAYKEEEIEQDLTDLKEKNTEVVLRKPPPYNPPASGAQSRQQQSPQNTMREQAVKAPLKKQIEGFGGNKQVAQNPQQGNILSGIPIMSGMAQQAVGGLTKDQYTQDTLQQLASLTGVQAPGTQNDSTNNGRYSQAGAFSAENTGGGNIQVMDDTYLFPGTIIHAVLVSAINTDFPADITARVIENVYDSKTGRKLLIPQGSILKGNYSSSSFGIDKVQIAWNELIINYEDTAYLITLGGMAGVDQIGRAHV